MKVIKGLILVVFVGLCASSCFDPPEFPIEPEIDEASVYFLDNPDPSENDTLMLSITFKDGDGDLGLEVNQTNPPFHPNNYFLAKDGVLHPVAIYTGATNENPPRVYSPVLDVQPDDNGKLATIFTRDQGYNMPPLEFPYTCSNYTGLNDSLYLLKRDQRILDATHHIKEVIMVGDTTRLLKISGSNFYYESNPDQYNITVEFQMQDANGVTWTTYDWRQELCTTFDGRFPVLSDKSKPTPLDGTLHYAM